MAPPAPEPTGQPLPPEAGPNGRTADALTIRLDQIPNSTVSFAVAGGGPGRRAAGTIIIRAAVGNSGTPLLFGFGSPVQELSAGEGVAIDIPPGYWVDLANLFFNGNGSTTGVVFVTAIIVP